MRAQRIVLIAVALAAVVGFGGRAYAGVRQPVPVRKLVPQIAQAANQPTGAQPAAKWYAAVTERGIVGPFRRQGTAINFCIGRHLKGTCQVVAMVSPKEM